MFMHLIWIKNDFEPKIQRKSALRDQQKYALQKTGNSAKVSEHILQ